MPLEQSSLHLAQRQFFKAAPAESPMDMGPFSLPSCLCLHGLGLPSRSRPVQFGFDLLCLRLWVSDSFFRMDDRQPSFTLSLGQGPSPIDAQCLFDNPEGLWPLPSST
ncbi:rCG62027 [Rattus norvegicus]|uniref:RCG62027 n=1 Tax=Rattus norvegicus TaxID=10116 RepID=A6HCD3_RAT|nr:rCG62027 [Rattus norvegicus]